MLSTTVVSCVNPLLLFFTGYADPIKGPPPTLGKRTFQTFREFGRAAAEAMKFVPIPDGDSMPKRGRGCGEESSVIFPRGSTVSHRKIKKEGRT